VSTARIEDHSIEASPKAHNHDLPTSDERDLLKAQNAASDLPAAYQALARATSLPEGSIDPDGRTLPKGFAIYLENENAGYDQFVAGLSPEGAAAFNSMKQASRSLGVIEFIESVVTISPTEKPSTFDFIIYSSLKDQIREYPAHINGIAQAQIARNWSLLSQSANPVFRHLAIEEANRVIKDKNVALALLDARTSEVDPLIVKALIDQLVLIGGDAAKATLKRLSDNALERRDQAVSKAAEDAITKLK
jgi:hypothetical protein